MKAILKYGDDVKVLDGKVLAVSFINGCIICTFEDGSEIRTTTFTEKSLNGGILTFN